MYLSENLKFIRERLGLTQTEFGDLFGVTKSMILTYEIGKARPKKYFLDKVSHLIGLSVEKVNNLKIDFSEINVSPKLVNALLVANKLGKARADLQDLNIRMEDIYNKSQKVLKEGNEEKSNYIADEGYALFDLHRTLEDECKRLLSEFIDVLSIGALGENAPGPVDEKIANTLLASGFFEIVNYLRKGNPIETATPFVIPEEEKQLLTFLRQAHEMQITYLTALQKEVDKNKELEQAINELRAENKKLKEGLKSK